MSASSEPGRRSRTKGKGSRGGDARGASLDPIELEIFRGLYVAICEEMGSTLMRSASSPNIKERRDYSCAIFDHQGRAIAQGDHMPVHLGSMPASVSAVLDVIRLGPRDVAMVNDPFHGGTHLPDITLVSPVFVRGASRASFYVACRAHHSDVGGMQAGSMPLATEIYQEGLILPPLRLVRAGRRDEGLIRMLLANVRTPHEREEDLAAQCAALVNGERALLRIVGVNGRERAERAGAALRAYAERMMRRTIAGIPDGVYRFDDRLDDDGFGSGPIPLTARIAVAGDEAVVDLRACADQVRGGVNAVRAITVSCVLYVFRCLIEDDVPSNEGLAAPLSILTRPGSIVDAVPPAAVAAGNVETSQRIVDLLFGSLASALPGRIPAASQGTMNNLAIGGETPGGMFAYYETIAGGMGARPGKAGLSGVHTHMTNSLNTPVEALEQAVPLRVAAYTLRRGSGGAGRYFGGDGIVRAIEALSPADFSILSDRRQFAPYGLAGGEPGAVGRNRLRRAGSAALMRLPGKTSGRLEPGDLLVIESPGGGGWGKARTAPSAKPRAKVRR